MTAPKQEVRHAAMTVDSPSPPVPAPRLRSLPTIAIWTLSLVTLAIGGVLASLFVMMPVSLDVGEMVAGGVDPWRDAAYAALAYCGLFGASAGALVLWHRRRGHTAARLAAWAIAAAAVAAVAFAGALVLRDWF